MAKPDTIYGFRFVSERRRAFHGHSHTRTEFVDHYGQIVGAEFWAESPVVLPVLAPEADVLLPSGFRAGQEPLLAADASQIDDSQQESQPAADVCQLGDSKQSDVADSVCRTDRPICNKPRSSAPSEAGKNWTDTLSACMPLAAQIDGRVWRSRGLNNMLADELRALTALRTPEAALQAAEAAGLGAPPGNPLGLHLRSAVGRAPRAIAGAYARDVVRPSTPHSFILERDHGRINRSRSRHRVPIAADIAGVQPNNATLRNQVIVID